MLLDVVTKWDGGPELANGLILLLDDVETLLEVVKSTSMDEFPSVLLEMVLAEMTTELLETVPTTLGMVFMLVEGKFMKPLEPLVVASTDERTKRTKI